MNTEHLATLAALQEEFPAFRITLESTLTGPRYIVRSRHFRQNPHTLITRDPAELRAVLGGTQLQKPQGTRSGPGPAVPVVRPRRSPA